MKLKFKKVIDIHREEREESLRPFFGDFVTEVNDLDSLYFMLNERNCKNVNDIIKHLKEMPFCIKIKKYEDECKTISNFNIDGDSVEEYYRIISDKRDRYYYDSHIVLRHVFDLIDSLLRYKKKIDFSNEEIMYLNALNGHLPKEMMAEIAPIRIKNYEFFLNAYENRDAVNNSVIGRKIHDKIDVLYKSILRLSKKININNYKEFYDEVNDTLAKLEAIKNKWKY